MVRVVKLEPRALLLAGAGLVAPLAVAWVLSEIRGPSRIFIGPGTYWIGWLLLGGLLAALLGAILLVLGLALALYRFKMVR